MAAKKFRQPIELKERRGIENRAPDAFYVVIESVAREAQGERAVFDRPYRAAMVAERIVCRIFRRKGAKAPSREKVRAKHAVGRSLHQRVVDNSRADAMPRVRANRANRPRLRVESYREVILFLHPKSFVEPLLQFLRLLVQCFGLIFSVEPPQHFRKKSFREIYECLLFACGNRR